MSVSYTGPVVTIRDAAFEKVFNSPTGPVGKHMKRKARLHVNLSRRLVGKSTGQTMRSIHYRHSRTVRGQFVEISANSENAYRHHEGTRPHVIDAGPGRVLQFRQNGRTIYARYVLHPGTRPNRFLTNALVVWRA